MGVISEQVATEIIKYPEVLRVCAVSVVACSFLPKQCSFSKAKTDLAQTTLCLHCSFTDGLKTYHFSKDRLLTKMFLYSIWKMITVKKIEQKVDGRLKSHKSRSWNSNVPAVKFIFLYIKLKIFRFLIDGQTRRCHLRTFYRQLVVWWPVVI